jgi:hypothetical protein
MENSFGFLYCFILTERGSYIGGSVGYVCKLVPFFVYTLLVMHKDYCNGTRNLVLSFHVLFPSDYWFSQLFRNFFPAGSQSLISKDKTKY